MPKVRKQRIPKMVHPNSRKALEIAHAAHRNKQKLGKAREKASKLDTTVEKLLWFQSNLDKQKSYSKTEYAVLVERYFQRFNEELEQIEIIRSVGCRKPTQHFARERAIRLASEHEHMLYESTGLELPDIFNRKYFSEFMDWDGSSEALPRLKLIRFSKPKVKD